MKGDAIRLAQLSAQIQTAGAAVGVLDVARGQLAIADQAVDLIPAGYAVKDGFAAGLALLTGQTGDVQSSLRSSIGQARVDVERYAAFYKGYVGDDLSQEISTAHSMGIASTIQFVNKVLNECIDEIGDGPTVSGLDFVNGVAEALAAAAAAAGRVVDHVIQGAANATAGIVSAFWVPLVVVGGGVLLFVAWKNGLLKGAGA